MWDGKMMGLIFLPDVSLSGSRNGGRSLCSSPLERLLQLMLKGERYAEL